MANRQSPVYEARSRAQWALQTVGRELRVARYRAGMTQRGVGSVSGRTGAWVSLVERGKAPRVALAELAVIAAAVGLKLYVNAYPAGRRPLDAPQLALLTDFNARIHRDWRRELEKVMPREGDLRAVDELLSLNSCSIAVEAITRFADVQAQVRAARAKQRDLGATRLALVVRGSRANRRLVTEAEPLISQEFPVGTRAAMRALAAGEDPEATVSS
jgi:transcriptional regulator with XRE-family HTH domain